MSACKLTLGTYDIDLLDKIGQGSYGVVYKGINNKKKYAVAAKQCDVKCEKAGSDAMLEIKHFQSVQNQPHIVQLYDFHYKDRAIWMIMEYCDAGDLDQYFKKKVPDMKEQVNIMYQSASAVSYMHCQVDTVIHRDIKPGNILMKIQGGQAIVKVTDFGLSKIVESVDQVKSMMCTSKAGTPGFMAPEFFLSLKYGKSVDVFALGLVFLAMIGFKSGDQTLAPIVGSILLPIGAQMANLSTMNIPIPEFVKDADGDCQAVKSVKKLVRRMLKYAPKERCYMRQVVAALEDMGGSSPGEVPTTIPKYKTLQTVTMPATETTAPIIGSSGNAPSSAKDETEDLFEREERSTVDVDGESDKAFWRNNSDTDKDKVPEKEALRQSEEKLHKPDENKPDDYSSGQVTQSLTENAETDRNRAGGSIKDNDSGVSGLGTSRNVSGSTDDTSSISKSDMLTMLKQWRDRGRSIMREDSDEEEDSPTSAIGRAFRRFLESTLKEQFDVGDDVVAGMRGMSNDDIMAQCMGQDEGINEFELGDQVVVLDDVDKVRQLQDGYGGFPSGMAKYVGKLGVVKEKLNGRMVRVLHDDGQALAYNPKAVSKTGKKPFSPDQLKDLDITAELVRAVKSKFKRFDVVTLPADKEVVELLQDDHGGWNEDMESALGMKGLVKKVDSDGDVHVEFINGHSWCLNPEVLIPCDMSGVAIEAGDLVLIADDRPLAEHFQRELGNWDDSLKNKLGHCGRVQEVTEATVAVKSGKRTVQWHPSLIKLVAKGETPPGATPQSPEKKPIVVEAPDAKSETSGTADATPGTMRLQGDEDTHSTSDTDLADQRDQGAGTGKSTTLGKDGNDLRVKDEDNLAVPGRTETVEDGCQVDEKSSCTVDTTSVKMRPHGPGDAHSTHLADEQRENEAEMGESTTFEKDGNDLRGKDEDNLAVPEEAKVVEDSYQVDEKPSITMETPSVIVRSHGDGDAHSTLDTELAGVKGDKEAGTSECTTPGKDGNDLQGKDEDNQGASRIASQSPEMKSIVAEAPDTKAVLGEAETDEDRCQLDEKPSGTMETPAVITRSHGEGHSPLDTELADESVDTEPGTGESTALGIDGNARRDEDNLAIDQATSAPTTEPAELEDEKDQQASEGKVKIKEDGDVRDMIPEYSHEKCKNENEEREPDSNNKIVGESKEADKCFNENEESLAREESLSTAGESLEKEIISKCDESVLEEETDDTSAKKETSDQSEDLGVFASVAVEAKVVIEEKSSTATKSSESDAEDIGPDVEHARTCISGNLHVEQNKDLSCENVDKETIHVEDENNESSLTDVTAGEGSLASTNTIVKSAAENIEPDLAGVDKPGENNNGNENECLVGAETIEPGTECIIDEAEDAKCGPGSPDLQSAVEKVESDEKDSKLVETVASDLPVVEKMDESDEKDSKLVETVASHLQPAVEKMDESDEKDSKLVETVVSNLQPAVEKVNESDEKDPQLVETSDRDVVKPTREDSITDEDACEGSKRAGDMNKHGKREPEKEYIGGNEESGKELGMGLSSLNEENKEEEGDNDEGATGFHGTSANYAKMNLESITDNNYTGSTLAISRNEASNLISEPSDEISSSFLEVIDLGDKFYIKRPPGVRIPHDGDDESDEKFLLARQGLEHALKKHLGVGDDVIAGMRDMKFRELVMMFDKGAEEVREFEVGDQVIVLDDESKVRRLQDGYGGYSSRMAKYLGQYGIVKKLHGRVLRVMHDDGLELHYNPKAVKKTGEKPLQPDHLKSFGMDQALVETVKSKFQRADIVILCEEKEVVQLLQGEHGLWDKDMKYSLGVKGIVNRVNSNGDVFVQFINGDDWTVNPEALIPHYVTDESVDVGDVVLVYCDRRQAKQRQLELGLWRDSLEDLVGKLGIVSATSGDTVTLNMDGKSVRWHRSLIRLVAKMDEMVEISMRKSMRL